MKKFGKIKQIINDEFPKFTINSIKKIGEGDNSTAFLINKNYIFRFPKRKEVKRQLKKEIDVLPKIRTLLNVEIPAFDFISINLNFVGHKSISGEFLSKETYNSLSNKKQVKIQKSLALFLTQLHKINSPALKDYNLEIVNYREEYLHNLKDAKKLIFPNIKRSNREIITQAFNEYLNNKNNFNYKPALIHNDLSTDHILFKKKNSVISGIIDFGDLAIGDPDYDLMHFLNYFGEGFILKLLKFYKHKSSENLLKKLYFFTLANKLQILIESIKVKDESLKDDYKNLKNWIKEYRKREFRD